MAIAVVVLIAHKPQKEGITKQQLLQKFQTLKAQYEQTKKQGLDVSEIEKLGKEAKQAFDNGDYKRVLEEIKTSKTPPTTIPSTPPATTSAPTTPLPETLKEEARKKLSQVKIVSQYRYVTDGIALGRSLDEVVKIIKEKTGMPVFARIDYGGTGRSALNVFSQELTPAQAKEFLKIADKFYSDLGVNFIYPIHGGDMGPAGQIKRLSYGKYDWYDSLAPEFQTYETIKELAQKKR